MRDYIDIGPVPCEESCEQLGPNYRPEVARKECEHFIARIRVKFGPEPEGAQLKIKSFAHDYGTYYEVVCYYTDELPDSIAYAFAVEANSPMTWYDQDTFDWRKNEEIQDV